MMKLLDLFSGIGGFSLGLESTGYFKTIAFCEKDEFCQKVLKKHWKDIPIESEIRNVKGSNYKADIITGGFPCQPFSVAGKRKGTDDDRYLWDETIRVIRETKPRWFIGENVEGIINIQDGMVLRQVQNDLEAEGFQVQSLVIPASGIGAWHQRKRVWIIAHSNSNRDRHEITKSNGEEKEIQREHRKENSSTGKFIGADTHDVPNTNSRLSEREASEVQARRDTSDDGSENVSYSNSFRHGGWSSEGCANREWSFLPREQEGGTMGSEVKGCYGNVPYPDSEGLQGLWDAYELQEIRKKEKISRSSHDGTQENVSNTNGEGSQRLGIQSNNLQKGNKTTINSNNSIEEQQTWWQTQSRICGVPHGISFELDKARNNRIKSLGNSIVPQIVRQLGLAIMEAENDNN